MKKVIYISLFLMGCFFLVITSCKKDKTPNSTPCTTCQKVTEAKDYFAFKIGSWWVYEEETSQERDSVYVTESTIDANGYNFDIRMFSTYQNFYYHYWPTYISNLSGCNETNPISKKCLLVNRSKYQFGNYVGEGYCFFIAYRPGDYVGSFNVYFANNKVFIEQIFTEFNLDGLMFEKTIKTHELSTFIEGIQPTNHFFSKGVGLIRKELIDSNQVWNLVNYHIEP